MQSILALMPVVLLLLLPLLDRGAILRAQQPTARAELRDRRGARVGDAVFEQTPHGVLVTADLAGLPAGAHAIHVHDVGRCEPPFESAGDHFDPLGRQHGFRNPAGPHAGDLPNIHVPESGEARVEMFAQGFTLTEGSTSLFDGDGAALILHAGPDDYRTDPAGDSGERIACGVVER